MIYRSISAKMSMECISRPNVFCINSLKIKKKNGNSQVLEQLGKSETPVSISEVPILELAKQEFWKMIYLLLNY